MKRRFIFIFLFICILAGTFAKTVNDTQIVKQDSAVYNLFLQLQKANKQFSFTNNTPLSVGEMKFYLKKFEYEKLNNENRFLYDQIYDFLYEKENLLETEDLQFIAHPKINLETYYKTNSNIPWSFDYNFIDNFISMPIIIGFGNDFSFGSDFFFGKNYIAAKNKNNKSNIPIRFNNPSDVHDMEFYFPFFAFGSFGKYYENWGYNLNIGKKGKTVGNTLSGSIIYNETFETDAYIEFDLYSDFIKYTMDVIQISSNRMDNIQMDNTDRYLYMHQIDIRLFNNLKISFLEGSLTANPFSIRFLNPLIFMHQFGGWTDYITSENSDIYRETNFCADFAYLIEYIPIRNLRLYGIYNQIEMQMPWERDNYWGHYYPNSIGLQVGADYTIFCENNSIIDIATECFYNSPYMYIKQTPSSSLYRIRTDMQTKDEVYSWIGSPYGPDCLGNEVQIKYNFNNKWGVELDYLFLIKGEIDFNIFDDKAKDDDGNEYYSYYPSVLYKLLHIGKNLTFNGKDKSSYKDDEIYKEASTMWISGIPLLKNQITLKGNYNINNSFTLNGQLVYNNFINFAHIEKSNKSGVELDLSFSYKL